MLNSARPVGRRFSRGGRLALVVPTALLAITAMVSPSFADDVTPDDGGSTPAVTETPSPSPEPDPAPAPEPDPAPQADPAPEPKPAQAGVKSAAASNPTPGAAFTDAAQAKATEKVVAAAAEDKDAKDDKAADDKKVVVCKYVGTPPGVAHHIIVVSKNAIKDWDEVTFPWTFADAQDSIAIRYAIGNEQPGDEELENCPQRNVAVPTVPVTDECGPDNAVYGEVPMGNYTILRNPDGSITLNADTGYDFPGGADVYVFPAPVDSDEPCIEPGEIDAPVLSVDDPCGVGNAVYGEVPDGPYSVERNDDGSITLTAAGDATFAGGETTYTYPAPVEINTDACVNEKKVVVCKYVSTPGGELDHIIIVSVATLLNQQPPWDGVTFPYQFPDAQDSVAIRFAEEGEQAKDVDVAECPSDEEPAEIEPPAVDILDPCDPDNASYGEVPLSDDYSVAYNPDGSITLTALGGATFAGGEETYTYPVIVEENTEACPVVDDTRVVICSYPTPELTRADGVLGIIEIRDLADLLDFGFDGDFPFDFIDGDNTSTAIRYAEEGEVAEDIEGLSCGIDGEIEENPETPDVPGEVDGIVDAALPNTGGPAGWLLPLGTGLVLAGAALVLARRREMV